MEIITTNYDFAKKITFFEFLTNTRILIEKIFAKKDRFLKNDQNLFEK